MEPIVLEPKPGVTPAEMAAVLEKSGLKEGSEVFIRRLNAVDEKGWQALLIIALVAIAFVDGMKRRAGAAAAAEKAMNDAWSADLLGRIYTGVEDVAALEQEIEQRTGVDITVEDEEWPTPGMILLNRAYGDDEIDISGIALKEPNPDYRP